MPTVFHILVNDPCFIFPTFFFFPYRFCVSSWNGAYTVQLFRALSVQLFSIVSHVFFTLSAPEKSSCLTDQSYSGYKTKFSL